MLGFRHILSFQTEIEPTEMFLYLGKKSISLVHCQSRKTGPAATPTPLRLVPLSQFRSAVSNPNSIFHGGTSGFIFRRKGERAAAFAAATSKLRTRSFDQQKESIRLR